MIRFISLPQCILTSFTTDRLHLNDSTCWGVGVSFCAVRLGVGRGKAVFWRHAWLPRLICSRIENNAQHGTCLLKRKCDYTAIRLDIRKDETRDLHFSSPTNLNLLSSSPFLGSPSSSIIQMSRSTYVVSPLSLTIMTVAVRVPFHRALVFCGSVLRKRSSPSLMGAVLLLTR